MTVSELLETLKRQYEEDERASVGNFDWQVKNLRDRFGSLDCEELGSDHIEEFKRERVSAGRSKKTVNNALVLLRAAYRLAHAREKVARVPHIRLFPRADVPRQGFIEPATARAIASAILDPVIRDVFLFAYHTGWRKSEVLRLEWTMIDWPAKIVRLPTSKTGAPRLLPIVGPVLKVMTRRRRKFESTRWVFSHSNRPIRSFYRAWKNACLRAGCPGLRFHDARRSFARNGINSGLDEPTVMRLGGWSTRQVFERYCIRDEVDLRRAAKRIHRATGE